LLRPLPIEALFQFSLILFATTGGNSPAPIILSRVDLLLESDNLEVLAQSGLETAWVGAESGSQHILDAMDKGTQVKEIYQAAKLLKEKGIKVAFFLQFGYLGETKQDIDLTIKMIKDIVPDEIGVSVSYPLPGTKFYDKVKEELKIKQTGLIQMI
jgi:anaerobic magnesium-protoporphyrin IX monomethyl ester cyclase